MINLIFPHHLFNICVSISVFSGYTFNVVKADIDEYALGNRNDASKASDLVLLLANAKADAIIKSNKIPLEMRCEILLTADQVNICLHDFISKKKELSQEISVTIILPLYIAPRSLFIITGY